MAQWQHHLAQLAVVHPESISNYLTSKRQRRPSVRLGEIGDPPAAAASDAYLKRRKQLYPTTLPRQADIGTSSDRNGPSDMLYAKAGRVAKTRPLVHVSDYSHDQNFLNGIPDRHRHDVLDSMYSRGAQSTGNQSPMNPSSYVGIVGGKAPPSSKFSSKRSRNGKRRPGGPRELAPIPLIEIGDNENEKASGLDDTTNPLSDEHNDADTPEGFRDCDLETSEAFRDVKERNNLQEAGPLECQNNFREYHRVYESWQAGVKGTFMLDIREDRKESLNKHIGSMNGGTRELRESIHDAQAKSMLDTMVKSVSEVKVRIMPESNGNLNDGLPYNDNADKQFEQSDLKVGHCGALLDGVKVWLLRLGLGKYIPVFEAHEVDIDVLPLLTLDDLREMGINAVGTRRKMFCAIQKLGKSLITDSDSLYAL